MATVAISESLRLGIQDDLVEYYRNRRTANSAMLDKIFRTISTDKRYVDEVVKESIPFPVLWPLSMPRAHSNLRDRYVRWSHKNFSLALDYNRFDEEDETIKGDLTTHLQQMATRFRQIQEQLMADYINNSASLGLPIENAFDGAALTATTDGDGAARLGVSGGNVVSHALQDEADILDAIYTAQRQAINFKDTASQPFWSESEVDFSNMLLVASPTFNKVLKRAKESLMLLQNKLTITAEDNVLKNTFDYWICPRLTSTTSIHLFFVGDSYYAPLALVDRKLGPEIEIADKSNDTIARETGTYTIYGHNRMGAVPLAMHASIKLDAA